MGHDSTFLNISQQYGQCIARGKAQTSKATIHDATATNWFQESDIHEKERRLLPEIFKLGSSHYLSDELYRETRNRMYQTSQQDSDTYVSLAQCCQSSSLPISTLQM